MLETGSALSFWLNGFGYHGYKKLRKESFRTLAYKGTGWPLCAGL